MEGLTLHCAPSQDSQGPQAPCAQGLLGPGWLSRDTLAFVSAQPAGRPVERGEDGMAQPGQEQMLREK